MTTLKNKNIFEDFQEYVAKFEIETGVVNQTATEKCRMLSEKVSGLFRVICNENNFGSNDPSTTEGVEDEIYEVILSLCVVANNYNIDISKFFVEKEFRDKQRQTTSSQQKWQFVHFS